MNVCVKCSIASRMTAILLNRTTYYVITRSLSGILLSAAVPREKRFMTGTGSDRFCESGPDRRILFIKDKVFKNIFK